MTAPHGLFDDLIPKSAPKVQATTGLFDDLIPTEDQGQSADRRPGFARADLTAGARMAAMNGDAWPGAEQPPADFAPAKPGEQSVLDALAEGASTKSPSVIDRLKQAVEYAATHKAETAKAIALAPSQAAAKLGAFTGEAMDAAAGRPVHGIDENAATRALGIAGEPVTPKEAAIAGAQLAVPEFLAGAAPGGAALRAGIQAAKIPEAIGSRAAGALEEAAKGAAIGASYSPHDVAVGAILGGGVGGLVGAARGNRVSAKVPINPEPIVEPSQLIGQGMAGRPAPADVKVTPEPPPEVTPATPDFEVHGNTVDEALAELRAMGNVAPEPKTGTGAPAPDVSETPPAAPAPTRAPVIPKGMYVNDEGMVVQDRRGEVRPTPVDPLADMEIPLRRAGDVEAPRGTSPAPTAPAPAPAPAPEAQKAPESPSTAEPQDLTSEHINRMASALETSHPVVSDYLGSVAFRMRTDGITWPEAADAVEEDDFARDHTFSAEDIDAGRQLLKAAHDAATAAPAGEAIAKVPPANEIPERSTLTSPVSGTPASQPATAPVVTSQPPRESKQEPVGKQAASRETPPAVEHLGKLPFADFATAVELEKAGNGTLIHFPSGEAVLAPKIKGKDRALMFAYDWARQRAGLPALSTTEAAPKAKLSANEKKYAAMPTDALGLELQKEQVRLEAENDRAMRSNFVRNQDVGRPISGSTGAGTLQAKLAAKRIEQLEAEMKKRGVSDEEIMQHRLQARVDKAEREGMESGEGDTSFNPDEFVGERKSLYDPKQYEMWKVTNPDGTTSQVKDLPKNADVAFRPAQRKIAAAMVRKIKDLGLPTSRKRRAELREAAKMGMIDPVGRVLKTSEDNALLMQGFRNPAMEVNQAWVKDADGKIVGSMAVTSGELGIGYVPTSFVDDLIAMAKRAGGVSWGGGHNHPSGVTVPSGDADVPTWIGLAKETAARGLPMDDQTVIDHDTATVTTVDLATGAVHIERVPIAPQPAPWQTGPESGTPSLLGPSASADYLAGVTGKGALTVTLVDSQLRAVAIVPLRLDVTNQYLAEWIPKALHAHAALGVIIGGHADEVAGLATWIGNAQKDPEGHGGPWARSVIEVLGLHGTKDGYGHQSYVSYGNLGVIRQYPSRVRENATIRSLQLDYGRPVAEQVNAAYGPGSIAGSLPVGSGATLPHGRGSLGPGQEPGGLRDLQRVGERDLFGNDEPSASDQGALFSQQAGTEASRSLKQAEAAAKAELAQLAEKEKVANPVEKLRIAKRMAELQKFVNRDKGISAGEMATRAKAGEGGTLLESHAEYGHAATPEMVRTLSDEIEHDFSLESFHAHLDTRTGDIALSHIIVPRGSRKSGVGTAAMERLTSFADAHGMRVILSPDIIEGAGATSKARLRSFYKRLGFVDNRGRNKDFRISESMYRRPQPSVNRGIGEGVTPYNPQTETPAFKKWFGDSKVVDAEGKPLVVYHGTHRNFDVFGGNGHGSPPFGGYRYEGPTLTADEVDAKLKDLVTVTYKYQAKDVAARLRQGHPFAEVMEEEGSPGLAHLLGGSLWQRKSPGTGVFFFSNSPETSGTYAEPDPYLAPSGNLMPVYLSLKDPIVVDAHGGSWVGTVNDAIFRAAQRGRDGAIIHNVVDDLSGHGAPSTVYVAFNPEQIKSATGNSGAFDPNNPSIIAEEQKPYNAGGGEPPREPPDYSAMDLPEPAGFPGRRGFNPRTLSKGLQAYFNPESLGPEAKGAAGTIRYRGAERFQQYAQTTHLLQAMKDKIDRFSKARQVQLYDQAENGEQTNDPSLNAANRVLFTEIKKRTEKLVANDRLALDRLIANYLGRYWADDPDMGGQILALFRGKKPFEGPKSFLKKREWPTFVDGLKAIEDAKMRLANGSPQEGDAVLARLKPRTYNYVEGQLHKIDEMDRLIAADAMKADEKKAGRAKAVMFEQDPPTTKDGRPWVPIDPAGKDPAFNIYGPKQGMVKLPGEAKEAGIKPEDVGVYGSRIIGKWYAHPDAAAVWHNFLSKGLSGQWYDAATAPGRAVTQILLGFSGFHGTVIATEGMFSELAIAAERAVMGEGGETAKSLAHIVSTPIATAGNAVAGSLAALAKHLPAPIAESKAVGKLNDRARAVAQLAFAQKVMDEYLKPGTYPELTAAVRAMVLGGYRGTAKSELWAGDRVDAFKKAWRDLLHSNQPLTRALAGAKIGPDAFFAGIEMLSAPLMARYVPLMKMATTYRAVALRLAQLERNGTHLSPEQMKDEMWQIVKDMDYRFGQVVYDNFFMHNTVKHVAQLLTFAPGWTAGSGLLLTGGTADLAKAPKRAYDRARGKPNPEGKPIIGRMGKYVIAAVVGTMVINGIMTYLNTGEMPGKVDGRDDGWKDFFAFRDGTTDVDGNPNRSRIPGYVMHDWYGWTHHPGKTAVNKSNPYFAYLLRLAENRTYFGDMIHNPDDPYWQQIGQTAKDAVSEFAPLSLQNYLESRRRDEPGMAAAARNIFGITPTSREFIRTPAQNREVDYLSRRGTDAATPEAAATQQRVRDALLQMRMGNDASKQLADAVEHGDLTGPKLTRLLKRAQILPYQERFKSLTLDQALDVFNRAYPWEQAQLVGILSGKIQRAAKAGGR